MIEQAIERLVTEGELVDSHQRLPNNSARFRTEVAYPKGARPDLEIVTGIVKPRVGLTKVTFKGDLLKNYLPVGFGSSGELHLIPHLKNSNGVTTVDRHLTLTSGITREDLYLPAKLISTESLESLELRPVLGNLMRNLLDVDAFWAWREILRPSMPELSELWEMLDSSEAARKAQSRLEARRRGLEIIL